MTDLVVFKAFGEAMAIGLLIGLERNRSFSREETAIAGIRTFTLFSLLGAVCGLLDHLSVTLVVFAALTVFIAIAYYRDSSESLGMTTEMAALLTFWLGFLVHRFETLAVSLAIVTVILLAAKKPMHAFVRDQISDTELFDTLKFLAVVFVVFPLLPDRDLGPYGTFNPSRIWFLIILVSSVSYSGYILGRLLGPRQGIRLSALLGGVVSTTAVTMSLAQRVRETPGAARPLGLIAIAANAVQFPRLLVLIGAVSGGLSLFLTPGFLVMTLVGLGGTLALGRWSGKKKSDDKSPELRVANPYSAWPAIRFGLLFVGISLFTKAANVWFGAQATLLATAIAGMWSVSASALSVAQLIRNGALSVEEAALGVLVALVANAVVKWALAFFQGSRKLAFWLGWGFITMYAVGGTVFGLQFLW